MSCKNIRSGNTSSNDPELLVQSRGRRNRTAPLFRHKGKRMVETHFSSEGHYRCVTSQTFEAIQAIYITCYCVVPQKRFNKSICATKEQKTKRDCRAMTKCAMPLGAIKSTKLLRRKSARIWQC